MSTITGIRKGVLADVACIANIHVRCWREVYAFMPENVQAQRGFDYRLQQWLTWFRAPPSRENVFVLLDNQRVVGFAVAKPNSDPAFDVPGEFHACYILPDYRGGLAGPLAMMALAIFLKENQLWPACIWAFQQNPYRRIYPALGCVPEIFRDRTIGGVALPEIGYRVPDYDALMARLDRMRVSAVRRQNGSLQQQPRPLRLPG